MGFLRSPSPKSPEATRSPLGRARRAAAANPPPTHQLHLGRRSQKSPDFSPCVNLLDMAEGIQGPERRIVLVGKTSNGKSATANTILGKKVFEFGVSPHSITKTCQKEETQWKGRKVVVVDTPGFFDTKVPQRTIAAKVILQVIRPGRFTQEEKDVAQLISKMFSLKAKNYIILLFTQKEDLEGTSLERFMREEPSLWAQAPQCGFRYLAFNNKAKGEEREAQVVQLMTMIDELVEKNKGALCYTEDMLKKDEEGYKEKKKGKKEEEKEEEESWCSLL